MLEKIKSENKEIFDTINQVKKLNIGFTNDVYSLDDKYILKICKNPMNESRFTNEIEFYLQNSNNKYIPKMISYHKSIDVEGDSSYEILEKLSGFSLYYVWHTFDSLKRKDIIEEISKIMKTIHSSKADAQDWTVYITNKIRKNLDICNQERILDIKICNKVINLLNKAEKYLNSSKYALIHSDIHFDNLIYTNNEELKLIDFETAIFAPIDYELDIFLRMCMNPLKYASEETEPFVKLDDYKEIENQLRKFYPEIFANKQHEVRMKYYDLEANIRLLPSFRNDIKLKQIVINIINELDSIVD